MALLEVSHLTRTFGGLRAVSNVSFGVEAGEILGLIGPNGAGKTTVFNLITGFLRPTSGQIRLNGGSIVGRRPHTVTRRGIARTFQIVKPFPHLTVRENATLAALVRLRTRAAARAESERVLEQVGLASKLDMPASDLTLSEQKRMEIARALATGPKLLLLDEPLGGLNASEIGPACELIQHIRDGGVTIVLVEHVMKAIMRISHRVVVMSQGEKIADAVPTEIVNDPAVIAAYLGKRVA
jgi:branched-chain amino acid transport system ATP-binding protein